MMRLPAHLLLLAGLLFPIAALAQPAAGFVEDFAGVTLGNFTGGATYSNPGAGGFGGASDGFLLVERTTAFHFGTRSSGSAFIGNYPAAGITRIRFALNDVGTDENFAMHFGIGAGAGNFWLYNVAFTPPEHAWAEFEVDLTNEAQFTRIRGSGTFAEALASVSNILIRHDLPPLTDTPDDMAGDLGIDHIQLLGPAPVEPRTWGQIKHLFQ